MPSAPIGDQVPGAHLIGLAREAAARAYAPYSAFRVGAAVQTESGVFTGCNVENASYGLSICAERVALFAARAAGAKQMIRIAVSCPSAMPDTGAESRMPCGACLQVMAELMPPSAEVEVDGVGKRALSDLLPHPFRLSAAPGSGSRQDDEL